jgi:hypothetical protein
MTFTGAWSRQQGPFYTEGEYVVHTADPAHADATASIDPNPTQHVAPEGVASSGDGLPVGDWMGGQGLVRDYTPLDHESGVAPHPYTSDAYIGASGYGGGTLTAQNAAQQAAGKQFGVLQYYNTGQMQFSDEDHFDIRSDGLASPGMDPITAQRGPNSLAENNPPIEGQPLGYRLGSDLVVGLQRRMQWGRRYHDRHVMTVNDAQDPTDQLRGKEASPYLSPFDSAKRAITRAWNTPERAQTPPPMDEDITQDTVPGYGVQPDWGFL